MSVYEEYIKEKIKTIVTLALGKAIKKKKAFDMDELRVTDFTYASGESTTLDMTIGLVVPLLDVLQKINIHIYEAPSCKCGDPEDCTCFESDTNLMINFNMLSYHHETLGADDMLVKNVSQFNSNFF